MTFRFSGQERVTIELDGGFDPGALDVPPRLTLELTAGRARVRLFAFHVDALRVTGVPWLRASYGELLWRIAAHDGAQPVWWVVACDLGHRGARWAAARWVRYPVRATEVEVRDDGVRARHGAAELALGLELPASGAPRVAVEARELRVGPDARWSVPWGDDDPTATIAPIGQLADSLSAATVGAPVEWEAAALVRRGRLHRCGVAQRA